MGSYNSYFRFITKTIQTQLNDIILNYVYIIFGFKNVLNILHVKTILINSS